MRTIRFALGKLLMRLGFTYHGFRIMFPTRVTPELRRAYERSQAMKEGHGG